MSPNAFSFIPIPLQESTTITPEMGQQLESLGVLALITERGDLNWQAPSVILTNFGPEKILARGEIDPAAIAKVIQGAIMTPRDQRVAT